MAGINGTNGITTKQALGVAGILLLAFAGGLVGMLLQGGKAQDLTIQALRLDVQELKSWKDNWKPQVDVTMAKSLTMDKAVDVLTYQLGELTALSKDLLSAIRTQKEDTDKQAMQAVRFQSALDRIEGRLAPRR